VVSEPKAWVVYLEPFDGGFVTARVEGLGGGEIYINVTSMPHTSIPRIPVPHILVPSNAGVKDEISAYMYAHRILENLQLNTTKKD
jgi:hypothetical protein